MLKNRGCLLGLVVLIVAVVLFFTGLDLFTDVAWFQALGFESVLWRRIGAQWLLFLAGWGIAALVLGANWWLARVLADDGPQLKFGKGRRRTSRPRRVQSDAAEVAGKVASGVLLAAAVGLGLFFGFSARAMWSAALLSRYAVPFGQTDPILGHDLSFYVFRLPWQRFVQGWFLWLVLFALGGAALIYLTIYSAGRLREKVQVVDVRQLWLRLTPVAEGHLLVLGAVALGLLAWGYQLNIPRLLYSTSGAAYGAGYADVHARLPVMQMLTWVAALGAVVLLIGLLVRIRWLPYAILASWLLIAFFGGSVYPPLLQRFSVEPNELTREREYIAHTIAFTRAAFGLDGIAEADLVVSEEAAPLDLEANETTIENIRLWDYRPLLRTYGQLQEIRSYYAFADVDVDRYTVDGRYRQVTLAAREIAHDELSDTAQTWINRHLIYTHGSGVVLSPVNEVGDEGLPRLWVRDIPPASSHPELALTRPEIYYGELTQDYVIARTEEKELDYPSGQLNVYATYEGSGGVVLDSALKRLAYALRLGDSQILLSNSITPESQLLWRRAIDERVRAVAPFLRYDPDPYPVIVDGRLVWLLDAYTATDRYPYSEPIDASGGRLNYVRNSVKVTMDAYNGTLTFYLIDPSDPLAATYAAVFPDLFRPVAEMDPALVAHWRYPEGLFRIQAAKFQTFHMTDPQVFYNKEDLWNWAEELVGDERLQIEPYYVNMRLPGEAAAAFILMLPYTPATKQNMIAWLYARNDGQHYGELGVFAFSKQQLVYGPMQVESRIDQDPVISQQLSLWNQRGSQVIRGNLLVIPVDQAILYVEPIYLQAEASQLPELRRVVVAYGNHIAMEETLAAGLARVMGGEPAVEVPTGTEPPVGGLEGTVAELILQADAHFQAGQECLKLGDWVCYGQEMEALEQVLTALVAATGEQ